MTSLHQQMMRLNSKLPILPLDMGYADEEIIVNTVRASYIAARERQKAKNIRFERKLFRFLFYWFLFGAFVLAGVTSSDFESVLKELIDNKNISISHIYRDKT